MRRIVISDVDGCLTDGKFVYTAEGKVSKTFGPHDNDGVKQLKQFGYDVIFISADKRGFPITQKRISDMKCELYQVSEESRAEWIKEKIAEYDWSAFFGDGISDIPAGFEVDFFGCPANARKEVKEVATFTTESKGSEGAFLDFANRIIELNRNND
jgi:3-deoxy-D-manno-octulosonate 8-phosphate phosphatase (KDO 8-P phosphatase)